MDLDHAVISQGLHYMVANPGEQFYLLAKIQGKPVGSIMNTYENKSRSWIQSVYVDANYRQKGIFRSLFNRLC